MPRADGHSDAMAAMDDGFMAAWAGTEWAYSEEDIGKSMYMGGVMGWTYGVDHLSADHNWVGTFSAETAMKFAVGIGVPVLVAVCVHAIEPCDTTCGSGALDAKTEEGLSCRDVNALSN